MANIKKVNRKDLGQFKLKQSTALEELLSMSDDEFDTHSYDLEEVDTEPLIEGPDAEFDISEIITSEIESFNPIARDMRIDDSAIPRARNFYHFCVDESFLNSPPYLEQALIGIKFMAEFCPRCSDTEWMHDDGHEAHEGLSVLESKVTFLEFGICPCCQVGRAELIAEKELNLYNELAVCAGQRSGKSAVTTMIAAYILHRFLVIGKPNDVFNIRGNEILHGTFIALTLGQAKENLWDPFYGYISDSPWFKQYHKFLRYHEKRLGEQLFKLKDTFVLYRHRNMLWYPATPDKRVLRGRTRLFGAIDELGWFDANRDTGKVKDNAHEVYKALSNSLATARQSESRLINAGFDQMLTGYMVNVSSPSSIRDKIVELVRVAKGSTKILGLHKPTWKMNPHLPRNSPIIEEEFRKDPIGAARDFGAEPSLSSYPFIPNHGTIIEAIRDKGINLIKYRLRTETIGTGAGMQTYRTAEVLNIKQSTKASVLAMDAGFTNNSFALSCGSITDGIVSVDCLVEIIPMPGIALNYTSIFANVIVPIIKARNVKILLADRWNSIKLLQDAQSDADLKLEICKQYSLKYTDLYMCRDALDQKAITIPRADVSEISDVLDHDPETYPKCFEYKPVEHLILQFATVQDVGKKQVIKGDGFTDDLWRATALMHWGAINPEYQEILAKEDELQKSKINYMANAVRKMSAVNGTGVSTGGNKKVGTVSGFLGVKRSMR